MTAEYGAVVNPRSINPLSVVRPDLFLPGGYTLVSETLLLPIEGRPERSTDTVYANVAELAQAASDAWQVAHNTRNVCITTNGPDGWPHATVIGQSGVADGIEVEGIVVPNTHFLFSSYPDSLHSRNLVDDPRATVAVYASGQNQGSFTAERLYVRRVPSREVPDHLPAINGLRRRWGSVERTIEEYDAGKMHTLRLHVVPFDTIMLPVRGLRRSGEHITNAAFRVSSAILAAA
jgi:hypothetical protein